MEPAGQGYSALFPLIVLAVALWFAWRAWQATRWPQVPAMVRAVERAARGNGWTIVLAVQDAAGRTREARFEVGSREAFTPGTRVMLHQDPAVPDRLVPPRPQSAVLIATAIGGMAAAWLLTIMLG